MENWNSIEVNLLNDKQFEYDQKILNDKLLNAVKKSDIEDILINLKNGANINQVVSNGFKQDINLLKLVFDNNQYEIFNLLINLKIDVNKKFDGYNLIWNSLWENKLSYFNILVKVIKKKSAVDEENGKTILMEAVEKSLVDVVHSIVLNNFNVNEKDKDGNTALHYLFRKKQLTEDDVKIMEILMNNGADKEILNVNNNTAEDLINMNGNENDVDLGNTVTNTHGGNTIGNTGGGYMKSKRPKKPVKGGPKYPTLKPKS